MSVLLHLCIAFFAAFPALAADQPGWFAFAPPPDAFTESAIDLRWLNEKYAGEHGRIGVRGGEFVHTGNGRPVRFWGINGARNALGEATLKGTARRLAKYGVNLARLHGPVYDEDGALDPARILDYQRAVAALREEGIYSHLSIYFPLWMKPSPGNGWLKGYDGRKYPFVSLMFNPEFQRRYREWWHALLLSPDPRTGKRLVDEPAVFGLELQNEDSFFFWTFNDQIPDAQLQMLEREFAEWLRRRYGSLDAALAKWGGRKEGRDDVAAGRAGFRPLARIAAERTPRDRDTTQFLFETQRRFYEEAYRYLRELGFKGLITASNWTTASPEVFGPLEKLSYTVGDFIDRHGYFAMDHKGEHSEWSIRNGHTYADRSALRFEPRRPGGPRQYVHPSMDPKYDGKPSMISETTWNRPNRYRGEAPLYYAAYGALQASDAIVHFALDGEHWSVQPRRVMQAQTLMAPSQVAQFPAAALLYRTGRVGAGSVLAKVGLNRRDLLELRGTPLPQDANLDELRLGDVIQGTVAAPGRRIDPLIHYAGRVEVNFTDGPGRTALQNLGPFVDRSQQSVTSTTGELVLDYGRGVLTINAPSAQGASGNLKAAGKVDLRDVMFQSDLDNVHAIVISLDGEPLARSGQMLLQVMSEERSSNFQTRDLGGGVKRILDVGRDPWRVKALQGTVRFKGQGVRIQPLDFNGYPAGAASDGSEVKLAPETIYYLVTRQR